ncbi:hypothetical protein TWF481_008410 [Arthrobotrys musiformis]|uniref:Uncharacterized protein n=1 Tax=Arthrobotrys musiformis TaxID=47236 RepID=A0AAV9W841_9PEZI
MLQPFLGKPRNPFGVRPKSVQRALVLTSSLLDLVHAEIPLEDGNPSFEGSSVTIRPWANTLGFSKQTAIWSLIVPDPDPAMLKYIKYIQLGVKTTGQEYDAAIRVDTTTIVPGSDGPTRELKLTRLYDKSVELFSLLQSNCRFLSFNTHNNKPDKRFEILYEIETVGENWQQASYEEKEFFACWPSIPPDPTQIQASKSSADTSVFPRLFGRGDIPGLECHQVWLYLTYYGYNYNFKKAESDDSDDGSRNDNDYGSEFALIEEALNHLDDEESGSETSGTDQVLTPLGPGETLLSGPEVDPDADTPLMDRFEDENNFGIADLQDPAIIDEGGEGLGSVQGGSFFSKAL